MKDEKEPEYHNSNERIRGKVYIQRLLQYTILWVEMIALIQWLVLYNFTRKKGMVNMVYSKQKRVKRKQQLDNQNRHITNIL
jgi:hypothetical protein